MDTSAFEINTSNEQKTALLSERTLTGKKRTRDSVQETKVVSAPKRLKTETLPSRRLIVNSEPAESEKVYSPSMVAKTVKASIPFFYQQDVHRVSETEKKQTLELWKLILDYTKQKQNLSGTNYIAHLYCNALSRNTDHLFFDHTHARALLNFAAFSGFKWKLKLVAEGDLEEAEFDNYSWDDIDTYDLHITDQHNITFENFTDTEVFFFSYGFTSVKWSPVYVQPCIRELLILFIDYYRLLYTAIPNRDVVECILGFATDRCIYQVPKWT